MSALANLVRASFRSAQAIAVFALCLSAPFGLSLALVSIGYAPA